MVEFNITALTAISFVKLEIFLEDHITAYRFHGHVRLSHVNHCTLIGIDTVGSNLQIQNIEDKRKICHA